MDKWVKVTKPVASRLNSKNLEQDQQQKPSFRYNPYSKSNRLQTTHKDVAKCARTFTSPERKLSTKDINKVLLSSLSNPANPITNDTGAPRFDNITSMTTGHQRNDGPSRRSTDYFDHRTKKLKDQAKEQAGREKTSTILKGTSVYIDGYLANTTDIEMKRTLNLFGARVLNSASGATHILTSQQLSGSKTHRLLTQKTRIKTYVVKPEWVNACIEAGKRVPERPYSVLSSAGTKPFFASDVKQKEAVPSSSIV